MAPCAVIADDHLDCFKRNLHAELSTITDSKPGLLLLGAWPGFSYLASMCRRPLPEPQRNFAVTLQDGQYL